MYRIRDAAGQAVEYKNYMLPILQDKDYFWLTGTRSGLQQQYRWLRIPLDKQLKADTFMALREFLKDGEGRKRLVADATKDAPAEIREQFMLAAENTLNIFAQKAIWDWTNLLRPISRKGSRIRCRAISTKCFTA